MPIFLYSTNHLRDCVLAQILNNFDADVIYFCIVGLIISNFHKFGDDCDIFYYIC